LSFNILLDLFEGKVNAVTHVDDQWNALLYVLENSRSMRSRNTDHLP